MQDLYQKIPQVASLLETPKIKDYLSVFFYAEIKTVIESSLADFREKIKAEAIQEITEAMIVDDIVTRLSKKPPYALRKVINGTGTIIHTNLGRSILSKQAIENVVRVATSYSNLEYDLDQGTRGSRYDHVEHMIATLLGAESALVVNNNAAATMLAIAVFSQHKEVVISRGELVEIGGSFRIPDIIKVSGAILKEVGTTNRTHRSDYEQATTKDTAMYLKVHPSNYYVQGFTKHVSNETLVQLAQAENVTRDDKIMTMEDLGSGALIDFSRYIGLKENTVSESLKSGMDIVTFSADKLLGGPQAGIIVGKKHHIDHIKKHPLCRVLRVCKLTISALEGTLRDYYDEAFAMQSIPTLNMMMKKPSILQEKAQALSDTINQLFTKPVSHVVTVDSTVGGGALPSSQLPSYAVTIAIEGVSVTTLFNHMKAHRTPVIGLIRDAVYLLDVRTLQSGDEIEILAALGDMVTPV